MKCVEEARCRGMLANFKGEVDRSKHSCSNQILWHCVHQARPLLKECDAYFYVALPDAYEIPLTDLCGDLAIIFHSSKAIWKHD